MKHQYTSRWSRIIFLCLCLSVIEQGWVRKTYSCEFIAGILGHELLYAATMFAGALMSRAWNNAPYSSADHVFQQDVSRLAQNVVTPSSPSSISKPQGSSVTHPPTYVHREPVIHHISPEVVHKTTNVVDTARAVAVYVAKEQDKPNVVSAVTTQELVHAVSVDWRRQVEQSCQESLRKEQLYEQYSLQTKIQQWSQDQAWTREMHANGGVTCHAPNPIFSIYLGPSRRQHAPTLADDIVEQRAQERIQLACDPELRAAVTKEFCAFLRNDYCLLYGTLLERIAALLYLADFHIDVVAFGQPLNAIQKEIYAEYACTNGSICIDRLADMTDAHAIIKKHIAFQKKMASHFEKPCRPVCGVCENKGKQCEHLRLLRKNSQLIKNKKHVDLRLIRNNHTNQCYKSMLSAFASGNMQQVEEIKNDNSRIAGVQTLYEQIRIAYNNMVVYQESLLKDTYGIWHFKLPVQLWDPLYTALSTSDRLELQNNPTELASFNDALLMRHRYKGSLHKAWNIPITVGPVVHQALYTLIDHGTISDRIDKIHELTNNPVLSQGEKKELVEALFLPNGIIKDFAEYERAQSLKMPRTILEPEYNQTRKLLNQLVYAERIYDDQQDQTKLEYAIECIQYALITDIEEDQAPYLSYAQYRYEQTIATTMLFNAQQQGNQPNNSQLPSNPNKQPNKNRRLPDNNDDRYERRQRAVHAMIHHDGCYETKVYTISPETAQFVRNIGTDDTSYQACYGNQLQQVIHQEYVDGLNHLATLSETSIIHPYKDSLIHCFDAAREYNQAGSIDKALMILDCCWSLLDYSQAIAEGGALGIVDAAQDILEHPGQALLCAIAGEYALAYQLSKVLYNVADIGVTYAFDAERGKKQWDEYVAPVAQLIDAISNKEVSLRDGLKGATQFAVQWKAQDTLLKGMNTFCKTAKAKALEFAKNNPLAIPEQYMTTPEGILLQTTQNPQQPPASGSSGPRLMKYTSSSKHFVANEQEINGLTKIAQVTLQQPPQEVLQVFGQTSLDAQESFLKHLFAAELIEKRFFTGKITQSIYGFHHYIDGYLEEMGIKLRNSRICKKTELIISDVLCDGHIEPNKTFFPTSWSREKVILKIAESIHNLIKPPMVEGTKGVLFGQTSEGIVIRTVIDIKSGKYITAYPDTLANNLK